MPRPTSPREELLRTPTPLGQAAGNPRRGFPPARKGFVFVDIPRKLDVGTATIRYLVNLPHVRVRCKSVQKCVSLETRPQEMFSSSIICIYGVSADFDTVAGTVGRANWLERPLLFRGETGTGASKMEVEDVNKVQ